METEYWSSFNKAIKMVAQSYSEFSSYIIIDRLQQNVVSTTEVTQAQANEIARLNKLLHYDRDSQKKNMEQYKNRISKLTSELHSENLAKTSAEAAGQKLSSDLHQTRQALNRSNEMLHSKAVELERCKDSYEAELVNLENARDEALQEIARLKSELSDMKIQQVESDKSKISALEKQLAETRLLLSLAQSERDEFELTIAVTDVDQQKQQYSASSLSSSSTSSARDVVDGGIFNGGSWCKVSDTK